MQSLVDPISRSPENRVESCLGFREFSEFVHRLDVRHGCLFGRALRSNSRYSWDPLRDLAFSKKGLYVLVGVRPPLNLIHGFHGITANFELDLRAMG